jgi:hypothetical protein
VVPTPQESGAAEGAPHVNKGEQDMKKSRITWISLAAAVVLLGLVGVALANRGISGPAADSGAGAGAYAEITDPDALAELSTLRADFADARAGWADEHSADRTSDEAQAAMQAIRDGYQADMQAVFDKRTFPTLHSPFPSDS